MLIIRCSARNVACLDGIEACSGRRARANGDIALRVHATGLVIFAQLGLPLITPGHGGAERALDEIRSSVSSTSTGPRTNRSELGFGQSSVDRRCSSGKVSQCSASEGDLA